MFTKADWLILLAAFLSFLFSIALWFGVGMNASKEAGVFVGLWGPRFFPSASTSALQRREGDMPDAVIFVVGSVVFLMVFFGLVFTVVEVRRLDQEAMNRRVVRSRNEIAG